MRFETENIEFKVQFTEDIYKEVIAFANTDGGTIYIGIDNEGNVVGLDNVDNEYARVTNGIRDAISPDVTMFVKYTLQDNRVIKITVGEGSFKPYYLKSKGPKPSGVFVRQGTSCAQASTEQIRQMIKATDGDVFEQMRSMEQDLTFEYAQKTFKRYGVSFSAEKYSALGITNIHYSAYTNLAQVISDQCNHTVKIAVFGNDANTEFRDSKEFGGSIFQQLDDAFSYLMLCNKTVATFNKLERIESVDYHEDALREALLNAIVHRDYAFSGSIIINVNDSQIEFVSIGGLVPGLSPEDIRSGISQPRNKNLAEIFHRLRLIESYGTGIRKIYSLYQDSAVKPRIEITPNTFKIILPNLNRTSKVNKKNGKNSVVSTQMQAILKHIEEHGQITDAQVQELLDVKSTRSYKILKEMQDNGLIVAQGRGANKKYIIAE